MNIIELGAVGELVGGLAVIGSLIYVGLQIRHNTATTRAASHHAITDSFNEWNLALAHDPVSVDVWLRGHRDRSSLSETERFQYNALALAVFRINETLFYQSRAGTGERRLLQAEERSLREFFSHDGARDWWHENPWSLDPEFREYIETFLPDASTERRV